VRQLAAEGFREVVYLGQTVNAYHDGTWDFADLLRRTADVDGIERIRFTSPHPAEVSDRLIAVMAGVPKVSPYLHLPVQSGSDRILRLMARDYDSAAYLALVDRLRDAVADLALSTDLIVGFPQEERADFAATLDLVRHVGFDHAFMFKYSRRSGTKAAAREETVTDEEKAARLAELIDVQESLAAAKNRRLIGRSVSVLVEGPAKRPAGWSYGRTAQFKATVLPGSVAAGRIVTVSVADSTAHTLIAAGAAARDPE
jgi:tRNA-2-methylthio-N6-dimethylallyladenosine synthase